MTPTKNRSNWLFLTLFTLLLTIGLSLPVLKAWLQTPPGQVFTGVSPYSPIDLPVYFADIKQIEQGHFLVHDLFTSESPQRGMFHLLWVVLGIIGRYAHLSPIIVFHAGRILLIPFLIWTLWWGIKQWLPQKIWRFGLYMTVFGSGTGALLNFWLNKPDISQIGLDYWVPEGFVLMSALQSPHYVLSLALFTLVLATWFTATRWQGKSQLKWIALSGILASILFSFHPFHIFTIGMIVVTHTFALWILDHKKHKKLWLALLLWLVCALPGAAYQIWLQWGDAVLRARSFQSNTPTPTFDTVYLCFAVLWVFALIGARKLWKTQRETAIFLLIWGVVQTAALFSPIQVNRRFIIGLQIDLTLLAAVGWWVMFTEVRLGKAWLRLGRWVVGSVVIMIVFFFSSFLAYSTFWRGPETIADLMYMTVAQKHAYEWIERNTEQQDVVLALGWPATLLPGETGRTTYVGHHHETLLWDEKLAWAQQVFYATDPEKIELLLQQEHIEYVLTAPDQRVRIHSDPVFSQGGWNIYAVSKN